VAPGNRAAPAPTDLDEALTQRLDDLVLGAARSPVPWLDAELGRLLKRPGKRIRPALVLAAARCGPEVDIPTALICAAAMELLHRSTLVHDDLMDEAPFRGAEPTLHQTSGLAGALLGGDYLFGAGGRLIARVSLEAGAVWHDAYVDLCDGQARETANRYRAGTPEEYLHTIEGKTGALIRAACQLGAMCGGLPEPEVRALAQFGACFGMVFQLVDDLMDVASTTALWGKPVQHDAMQGIYTLPVLAAADREGIALGPDLPDTAIASVYAAARRQALGPAIAASYGWADRASAALATVRPSPALNPLRRLPEAYVTSTLTNRVDPAHQHLVQPLLRSPS
jgi:geranylgeranyl pyrophosphate synthase